MVQSSYTVQRFSLCDLYDETEALMEINMRTESDLKKVNYCRINTHYDSFRYIKNFLHKTKTKILYKDSFI